uniref:Uncharacterized protein n=1 Tax=Pseudo-nitzschia australis TaxID=44445 RepID=A0A7S4EPN5_9STRA
MVVKHLRAASVSRAEKAPRLSQPKPRFVHHVVHVNVLGVAGIMVDRKHCHDVTGNKSSPASPEQMKAVVGVSEHGANNDNTPNMNVSTFSGLLIHAPSTKRNDNEPSLSSSSVLVQRHIAVWASNHRGETPGCIVESNPLETELTNDSPKHHPYASKFLDLSVALAKSGIGGTGGDDLNPNPANTNGDAHQQHHLGVVIGAAQLEITDAMMRGGENQMTMDLPVRTIASSNNYSNASTDGYSNRVVKLGRASPRTNRLRCVKQSDREKGESREHVSNLMSAYTIDPAGDSMIRVRIRVRQVHDEDARANANSNASSYNNNFQRFGSFANRTAATEESDDTPSLYFGANNGILPPAAAACRAFDALVPMTTRRTKSSTTTRTQKTNNKNKNGEELYSDPVEFPFDINSDDGDGGDDTNNSTFQSPSWKRKLLRSSKDDDNPDGPGCRVFGRNLSIPSCSSESRMAVAKRIDDRIERVARQVLHTECAVLGTNTTTDDDDDLSTPDRNDTVTTLTVSTGIYNKEGGQQERTSGNDVSGNLLEEMRDVIGPVPTMKKIKSFAKELVLTSGEYFFPEDTTLKSEGNTYTNDNANATNAKDNNSNNTIIEDYDDGSSVESATLAPFETSEQNRIRIRIRTGSRTRTLDSCDDDAESWKKKRDDDNRTYSTAGSLSFESTLNESTVLSGDKFDIDDDDDDNSNDVGVANNATHVTKEEDNYKSNIIDSYKAYILTALFRH